MNVVIHRGPGIWGLVDDDSRRGNFAFPRSYCTACHAPIARVHLVPLAGYLALGGKCASCGARIPIRYPVVELLGGGAALAAFLIFGVTMTALFIAIFIWFLIALSVIDFETGYLPDALTLPLIVIGIIVSAAGYFTPLTDALIGAVAGFLIFWIVGALFHQIRGIEGLGLGDAKLLAAIGAWLGWQAIAPTVLVAALIGLAGAFTFRLTGKEITGTTPIAFGPALAVSGVLILILAGILPQDSFMAALFPIFP